MATDFSRPTYYFTALNLKGDFNTLTAADVKKAYSAMAGNGEHPDHGGNGARWTLVTAAYNELKAIFGKKRGQYERPSDQAWLRNWNDLGRPVPQPEAPKAEETKAEETDAETPVWHFEEKDGESKDDRRKRYARERQAFRYATDPAFAASRKRQSRDSHQRHVQATKG